MDIRCTSGELELWSLQSVRQALSPTWLNPERKQLSFLVENTEHVAVGLSNMAFMLLGYVPFIPTLLRTLNGCWILSNAWPASIYMIVWFLSFNVVMWCYHVNWFADIEPTCTTGINPPRSWCMLFLMYCWIRSDNTLLKIFTHMFMRNIGL